MHILVVIAALVHLNGINMMADFVLQLNFTSTVAANVLTFAPVMTVF